MLFRSKKERIALSKKSLEDNPWKNVTVKRYDVLTVPVTEVTRDGIKVRVQGVEGDIPVNELSNEKIGRPEDYFAVGDEVTAIVTDVSYDNWALKLSIRRVLERAERASFEKYLEAEEESHTTTIGDLFEEELNTKKTNKK